ncbi:uncharacterized protein LOC135112518 [Scylla paramamosain]|uniref:uncharacterized protein LOC135112518 n=1 Tax=Scylla paramamosain TaxID=85552 RepID=UPI0030831C79
MCIAPVNDTPAMTLDELRPGMEAVLSFCFPPSVHSERPYSVTINHYESFCRYKYTYRRCGLMVRRHKFASARLRLGYPPPWQIAGVEGRASLDSVACANTIEHYCLACSTNRHLIPQGGGGGAGVRSLEEAGEGYGEGPGIAPLPVLTRSPPWTLSGTTSGGAGIRREFSRLR